MDPHSMGMQGGMSMPMSMGMGGGNPQPMGMGMNPMYGQQPMMMNAMGQQQMPMGSVPMTQMNPNVMNPAQVSTAMQGTSAPPADWRIQLTREHRANLIAKIYNEMVRVSADPVPGIKLWMNVSWYELSLYKESPTQEVYINKIFTRLKSLRAQQSDMNAAMAAQGLPNQGMLSRLDFSYYNTLNLNQRGNNGGQGQVSSYPGHTQVNGAAPQQGTQQQQNKPMSASNTPVKTDTAVTENTVAEYWQQHAALRAKHQGDVEKVHNAFKKYVDHMKGHDETEQKKKLRYLLSYVELCANILNEDKATHPPRKIEELDKVFKYIVKIVNPYLKKLRTETDKRSYPSGDPIPNVGPSTSVSPGMPTSAGATTSSGSSTMPTNTNDFSSAMTQAQPTGQNHQQNVVNTSTHMTAQQKQQQQYIMQQRAQQMQQQQQQMQAQARQQQMMQQQQMMRQQQMQQQKGPQQQGHFSGQQGNQQQNSQNAANQQSGQQTQQQMGQQGPPRPQQPDPTQHQKTSQPQQAQPQQQPQNQQPPTSGGENSSINSGLSLGLDDSLYGSMTNELLQMGTPSGTSSSGLMDFSNSLSPTFGGMDLLDWDDGSGQGPSGQGNTGAGGDGSDLMSFVETL
ncbi:hypothetical protein PHMEG_0002035 [Phytophthora megakarya]|uniref:Mediator complex subunit 15 KIX domain-containing protein n=1 Tax=Phytophthora megakarya TaxID=4795 RepID=A0A225X1L2_9STRA|nr:hypothetical protein PHMEG_0002035 [Phytophthora megakarya]